MGKSGHVHARHNKHRNAEKNGGEILTPSSLQVPLTNSNGKRLRDSVTADQHEDSAVVGVDKNKVAKTPQQFSLFGLWRTASNTLKTIPLASHWGALTKRFQTAVIMHLTMAIVRFVGSDNWGCWDSIKKTITEFFEEKASIYYDSDDQQRVMQNFLNEAYDIVENYASNPDEKALRIDLTDLVDKVFEHSKPVINLQMITGEKLELVLSAITGFDPHEFVTLRSDITKICQTPGNSTDSDDTAALNDPATEDDIVA